MKSLYRAIGTIVSEITGLLGDIATWLLIFAALIVGAFTLWVLL